MLESRITRPPAGHEPMVLAAFSYRYDAHLVPGLLENLSGAVHGHVAWNDTGADEALTPETMRRTLILREARRLGARWVLAVDPDERFEDSLAARLPDLLARGEDKLWMFQLKEMFTPDSYRTDGLWGGKLLMRLFPLAAVKDDLTVALHGSWVADTTGYGLRDARINLYHLRMATPERRRMRRDLYAAADPGRAFQKIGYDYLDDERGMRLERIPPGRGFSPAFVEDGGLWSPVPEHVGQIVPDAMEQRLHFVAQSVARQGHEAAFHVLCDLCAASPQDEDLPLLAASCALSAGLAGATVSTLGPLLARRPEHPLAAVLQSRALLALGRTGEAQALSLPPDCAMTEDVAARLRQGEGDFLAHDARWRRWVVGPATCQDGAAVARSDLAVVVIGFRAQTGLAAAVASVLDQDAAAEVVVVNSGGGAVRAMLTPWLDRIRLIEIAEPLYVGAARNVGIDASRAPYVAFLAGDCLAAPGWNAARLRRHRDGALTVATPVTPVDGAGLVAEAANRLLYWVRRPDTPLAMVAPFGRSYHRRLFDLVGYFPPGLRISEDDRLNRLADCIAPPVWAPEVLTRHRDPASLWDLLRAQVKRGENRADHAPFRAMAMQADRRKRIAGEMGGRLAASVKALAADPALSPGRRRGLALVQWVANRADRIGIARGLARIARAETLFAREGDLAALAEAARLDPQDWRKALRHAVALAKAGRAEASTEYRRGLALAPGEPALVDGLVRHLGRTSRAEALRAAEASALAAPLTRRHWDLASEAATHAGRHDLALAHALQALALAPNLGAAHRRVAACHTALGNHVAAMFRNHAAKRLESDAVARKAKAA